MAGEQAEQDRHVHVSHMSGHPASFIDAADIEFRVEGKSFMAHSQMVRFHSAVLNSMLEEVENSQENICRGKRRKIAPLAVPLPSCTAEATLDWLELLYTKEVDSRAKLRSPHRAARIARIAHKFDMAAIQSECDTYLAKDSAAFLKAAAAAGDKEYGLAWWTGLAESAHLYRLLARCLLHIIQHHRELVAATAPGAALCNELSPWVLWQVAAGLSRTADPAHTRLQCSRCKAFIKHTTRHGVLGEEPLDPACPGIFHVKPQFPLLTDLEAACLAYLTGRKAEQASSSRR